MGLRFPTALCLQIGASETQELFSAPADFLCTRLSYKSPSPQAAEADLVQRPNEGLSAQALENLSSLMLCLGLVRLSGGSSGAGTPLFPNDFRRAMCC